MTQHKSIPRRSRGRPHTPFTTYLGPGTMYRYRVIYRRRRHLTQERVQPIIMLISRACVLLCTWGGVERSRLDVAVRCHPRSFTRATVTALIRHGCHHPRWFTRPNVLSKPGQAGCRASQVRHPAIWPALVSTACRWQAIRIRRRVLLPLFVAPTAISFHLWRRVRQPCLNFMRIVAEKMGPSGSISTRWRQTSVLLCAA